jgi:ketosteroid isomerase-like protein
VDCINHRDLPGLVSLMSNDHHLQVFDETPVTGRDDNERAWSGYFDGEVAVLGHTTGQQLDARRGHAP